MKGIPPEVDSLMWRLAEEGSDSARKEFEARHVRYAPELARRVAMVSELRQAGKSVAPRPQFTPRPIRRSAPNWTVGAAVALSAFAIGTLAYVLTSKPVVPALPSEGSPAPVASTPNAAEEVPPKERPIAKPQPMAIEPPVVEPSKEPRSDTPRDVRIADTELTTAIQLVAAGGGLQVTVAPGFPNRKVTLDYQGLSTVDTLRAMGEEYGFSVLEEGEGAVLVVPVRAEANPTRRVGP